MLGSPASASACAGTHGNSLSRPSQPTLPVGEFVTLMALTVSLTALSIDAMLPALPFIASELGAAHANDGQYIISVMFGGFAVGQILFGPLSDSVGRKPAIYAGIGLFVLGCALSVSASSFDTMLAGRLLQGIGAAAPRVVTIALVRDQFGGDEMARIMSMIMAVFVLVPAAAPALGQLLIALSGWRAIFLLLLAQALIVVAWLGIRQRETLRPDHRTAFSVANIVRGGLVVARSRVALGYTVTAGLCFGGLVGYLTSAQQIFQELYAVGDSFPAYFAVLALAIGTASALNSKLVVRLGMRRLSYGAVLGIAGPSSAFFLFAFAHDGKPALAAFMALLIVTFFCIGILFGNLNAMAMEPLGHVAGIGAAVVGAGSTVVSMSLGTLIGQLYNGTVLPLVGGFAALGTLSLLLMRFIEAGVTRQATPLVSDSGVS